MQALPSTGVGSECLLLWRKQGLTGINPPLPAKAKNLLARTFRETPPSTRWLSGTTSTWFAAPRERRGRLRKSRARLEGSPATCPPSKVFDLSWTHGVASPSTRCASTQASCGERDGRRYFMGGHDQRLFNSWGCDHSGGGVLLHGRIPHTSSWDFMKNNIKIMQGIESRAIGALY